MIGTGLQVIAILVLLLLVVLCVGMSAHRRGEARFWILVATALLAIAVIGSITLHQSAQ